MLNLEFAVGILVDGDRVDDAYRAALAEPFQFGDHLAVEIGVIEPKTMSCTGPLGMSVLHPVRSVQPVLQTGLLRLPGDRWIQQLADQQSVAVRFLRCGCDLISQSGRHVESSAKHPAQPGHRGESQQHADDLVLAEPAYLEHSSMNAAAESYIWSDPAENAASGSRNQVAMRTAQAAACPTWESSSTSGCWRPSLALAIAAHSLYPVPCPFGGLVALPSDASTFVKWFSRGAHRLDGLRPPCAERERRPLGGFGRRRRVTAALRVKILGH